jgi:hypothetical protein
VLLAIAVSASVFQIGDFLYGHVIGAVFAIVMLLWTSTWFFLLPLHLRRNAHQRERDNTSST